MSTRFRCPKCGNDETFYANCYVEHHEAIIDNTGMWIGDSECYDSGFEDGRLITCPKCYFQGDDEAFEIEED